MGTPFSLGCTFDLQRKWGCGELAYLCESLAGGDPRMWRKSSPPRWS